MKQKNAAELRKLQEENRALRRAIKAGEQRRPTKTVRAHQRQALILWLEWRARQPDNPDPERTREILKGVRSGAYS